MIFATFELKSNFWKSFQLSALYLALCYKLVFDSEKNIDITPADVSD